MYVFFNTTMIRISFKKPAQNHDLNPIENIRQILDQQHPEGTVKNIDELFEKLSKTYGEINIDVNKKLFNSMPKRTGDMLGENEEEMNKK